MSKLFQRIIGTAALVVVLASVDAQAQGQRGPGGGGGQRGPGGPGGFDREAMMERMMERAQEGLGFSDAEWELVSPMLIEVTELQGNNRGGGGGIFALGRLGPPPEGRGGPDGGRGRRGGFFGEPDPVEEALAEAIESGASAEVLKEKMAALRKDREEQAKKLKASQEKLRGVLSVEQEAKLVMAGILP